MSHSTGPVYAVLTVSAMLLVMRLLRFDGDTPLWAYALVILPFAAFGAWLSTKHEALVYRRVARNRERAERIRAAAEHEDAAWDQHDEYEAGTASGYDERIEE
jgi:heme exporter protein D